MFDRGSRYEAVPDATYVTKDGRAIRHKRLRLIPPPGGAAEHVLRQEERLDRVAFAWFGDARQWWRIADANDALDPAELEAEPGRLLAIPAPGR
ncbi:hypothetical protein GXW74_06705 [Roseomonas eburnea]|uniref:LysM domain-containing protein n=1 Tax=Neoroseomonas eburnea TaxID=1346889 RepID=A0A9X9X8Y4_9PROT|nr:hypothetical protein [Neoroseomonas eburnea]MBR0680170.1 hypothetical protein [Neoroseomonas eburnea]